jgi:hypothetical protein
MVVHPNAWLDAIDRLKRECGGYTCRLSGDWDDRFGPMLIQHNGEEFKPIDRNELAQLRLDPPTDLFLESQDVQAVIQHQTEVLSNWSDCGRVFTAMAAVWRSQQDTVAAMLAPQTLDGSQYFYLLHLLIAVASGTAAMRGFANRIVGFRTDPDAPEYPNDVFINQLVYAVLLECADPNGDFVLNNLDLQWLMTELAGCITAPDDCSQAIKASLQRHRKVLFADSAYPMQDPEYPAVGFGTRKADTLNVLDKARAALR